MQDLRYRIGRVYISDTTPDKTIAFIEDAVKSGVNGYICVSNVRAVSFANKDDRYHKVMQESLMNTPDGMPLVWMARLWGLKEVQRTMGPLFFKKMLTDTNSGIRHFLLGDTEETLAAMRKKYGDAKIVGTFSPPFCEVDEFDYPKIADMINKSGADVVWVSLRAPKQDIFASLLKPSLDSKICVGVGAAFRFSLDKIEQPPKAIQKTGLTGIFWRKWDMKLLKFYATSVFNLIKWSFGIICSRLFRREKMPISIER